VTIDRERASDLGIDINGLSAALQAMLDGNSVLDVYVDGESYPVKLVSTTNPVNDPTDLQNIFLKTGDGKIVPMSTIATVEERAVAPQLSREQQLRSVSLSAGLTSGIRARRCAEAWSNRWPNPVAARIACRTAGRSCDPGRECQRHVRHLRLCARHHLPGAGCAVRKRLISGLIIMSTVPLGLACAVFAMLLTGNTLNIYSQIGLVLLVGIMAKNGILIVEFANQLRDRGEDLRSAIENAANIRLRPVMMTMIATIVGAVPLVLASGAGAEARIALGWVLVGGLGLATVVTLYLTPVAYLVIARFTKPHVDEERRLQTEMQHAETLQLAEAAE
jgi:HAE1 family hydrophobic/amphiphilic exporter-1